MTTEQHIREAFDKWNRSRPEAVTMYEMDAFFAGYMALLNELEQASCTPCKSNPRLVEPTYRLPEGVTK